MLYIKAYNLKAIFRIIKEKGGGGICGSNNPFFARNEAFVILFHIKGVKNNCIKSYSEVCYSHQILPSYT